LKEAARTAAFSIVTLFHRILGTNRRRLIAVALVGVACAGLAIAAYAIHTSRPGNVFHPNVAFQAEAPTPVVTKGPSAGSWPLYGYSKNHARAFPTRIVKPPFRHAWIYAGGSLLEFPPVIQDSTLFQLNDDGVLNAISKNTGKIRWSRRLGTRAAAAPAASGISVYVTLLDHGGSGKGRVIALRQKDGSIRWARNLPSRSESSPLLDRGKLYLGSENGTVYGLSAHDGHVLWTYHAGGAVKASPTFKDGKLYFGDYSDHMQAIRESDGGLVWRVSEGGLLRSGTFYSTPAAVFGRVFVGNTDGRVYAFDERNGHLAWAHQTGNYVYSSPAVQDTPGIGPTVYVGSYDGSFYALNAYSGQVRWIYRTGGRISGSPTVIGGIVYFANLARRETIGLDAGSGRRVWSEHTGSFDPVVTDGVRLYLTGYYGLYGLDPTHQPTVAATRPATAANPAPTATAAAIPYGFRWPPPLPNLLATDFARSQRRDAAPTQRGP
jgi:outer membrane protein assembly factor BamB